MTAANNPNNNLSPLEARPVWQPKWPAKRYPGYVLETPGWWQRCLGVHRQGRHAHVAVQEGSRPRKDQQVRPANQLKAIEMLLARGFGRALQQLAHSPQCLQQATGAPF